MPTFEPFSVVAVPFPYVEQPVLKRRPAVVVSAPGLEAAHGLLWVVMVTSARKAGWQGDIAITDLALAGLSRPSLIRPAKLAVVEAGSARRIGGLDRDVAAATARALDALLARPADR